MSVKINSFSFILQKNMPTETEAIQTKCAELCQVLKLDNSVPKMVIPIIHLTWVFFFFFYYSLHFIDTFQ